MVIPLPDFIGFDDETNTSGPAICQSGKMIICKVCTSQAFCFCDSFAERFPGVVLQRSRCHASLAQRMLICYDNKNTSRRTF